jgi:hypothetical protein
MVNEHRVLLGCRQHERARVRPSQICSAFEDLYRWIVLVSIAGVAWLLLGVGNIDPDGAEATTDGLIHGIGFLVGLPTRLAAPLVLAAAFRRDERWADHRRLTLALGITALEAEVAGFMDFASVVTLRLALALWLLWIAFTGARVLSRWYLA